MTSIIKVNTIQDVGGNNLLISNGSGSITTNNIGGQNTPAFLYTANSNQSISASTNVVLDVPTEVVDTDNAYDTTNKRFVVPTGKAGLYCFFIAYQYNGTATQNHTIIQRTDSSGNQYQNGGSNIDGGYNLTQDIRGVSMTMYYNLVVGDRVQASTQQYSGSTQTLYQPRTFFGGYRLIGA